MHELVTDDVVGIRQWTAKRQDNATAERFSDAACAFAQLTADRVRLLEVRMRGIQHERLASAELMLQHAAEPRVPALRHARSDVDSVTFFGVVVDVEVLGGADLPVDAVDDDVVLGRGRPRGGEAQRQDGRAGDHLCLALFGRRPAGQLAQRGLPLHSQLYQPIDLLRSLPPADRGHDGAGVVLGLQQPVHHLRLVHA